MVKTENIFDVVIIGGLGHVGLPLGIVFADKGLKVCLCDLNTERAEVVKKGEMPFIEYGASTILKRVLFKNRLSISLDLSVVSKARYVVIAIGTPVDEYLNPKISAFLQLFSDLKQYLNNRQVIVVRSTVYPHTLRRIPNVLSEEKGPWHIAYCPERIAQGYAVKELFKLPQLIAGLTERAVKQASKLFAVVAPKIIRVSVEEAELAKLFTNAWRYIQFAVANQFYLIANDFGVEFNSVRRAMIEGYQRTIGLPGAGFAAGPCLLKDTMQLAAFNKNNFFLGYSAMMINEGLPNYIVEDIRRKRNLNGVKVGILGMAFKADIDDKRDSLSYKLGKILKFHGAEVLYSDEYIKDEVFIAKERLIAESDLIIIGVPHSAYRAIKVPKDKTVVDLWGVISQ